MGDMTDDELATDDRVEASYRSRAAYMREYRARKRAERPGYIVGRITPTEGEEIAFIGSHTEVIAELTERILALSDEVARLKRQVAARPILPLGEAYKVEFRPAPKPGKGGGVRHE